MVAEKSARGLPGADGQGLEKQGHFLLTPALDSQDRLGGGEQRAGKCRMGGCQQPDGAGVGGDEEGEVQNLSCWLLFSNDLFNNYLCNQRSQGPEKVRIPTLHTPASSQRRK